MKTSIVAAFCAVVFAVPVSAQTGGDDASKPIKPGGVRITTKAPEPDRWDGQRSANGTVRVFKCKPLACPDAATATITFLKSPTRHPDPQAVREGRTAQEHAGARRGARNPQRWRRED